MSDVITHITETKEHDKEVMFNPFPGLRPFGMEESHLFFGREGQSDEVLKKLASNNFVAVIGASGSGKSSLMYCGLIPVLYGGFITDAGSKWRVVATRPGRGPIDNLADSLVKAKYADDELDVKEKKLRSSILSTVIRGSSLGLVDAVKQLNINKEENILILVDQFEELFRFKRSSDDTTAINESMAFVKLLLEAIRQTEVPIYVVLTMRSDFIGDCAQFPNLTKMINDSHYLIPQMTRDDMHDAIVGPVAVGGGQISTRLVQQLLNEVGDNQDQLPILQHAMMRTWDYWLKNREGEDPLDIQHYESIGKMERALSLHANEAYDELDENLKPVCEKVFKSLTEKGGDNRGIRRPTSIDDLANVSRATEKDVMTVVDNFRKAGRSFLAPSYQTDLDSKTVADISHESLMRIWDRLKSWVDEEANSAQMYVRLGDAAAMYQAGKTGLWRPPDLQLALNWRDKQQPTLSWAKRYDPAFERAIVFLETSEKAYKTEEENKIRLQKRALRRTRVFAIVLGTLTLISFAALLWAIMKNEQVASALAEVKEQKKAADIARKDAEQKKVEAEEQRKLAEVQRKEAEEQRKLAEVQRKEAEEQKKIAEQQTDIARRQTQIAKTKEKEANEAKEAAEILRIQAESALAEVEKQKTLAEAKEKEAQNLRMLSIAKSMAVTSTTLRRDTAQKALVALGAYQISEKFGTNEDMNSPEVYEGLNVALLALKGDNHNKLIGHTQAVRSSKYNNSTGVLYTAGSDGKLMKWAPGIQGNPEVVLDKGGSSILRSVDVNDRGQSIVTSDQTYIDLIEASGQSAKLEGHTRRIFSAQFAGDKVVSSSADSTVRLWSMSSYQSEVVRKSPHMVKAMTVQDNKMVYMGTDDGKVIKFPISNPSNQTEIYETKNRITALASTKGMVAIGDNTGHVRLINSNTGKPIALWFAQKARIGDLDFSPDGKLLASASWAGFGGNKGNVMIWRIKAVNEPPVVLDDFNTWVRTVTFSPDSKKIIAGCNDNLVRIYPTSTTVMADQICGLIDRNLSEKEYKRFVAEDIDYEKFCPALPVGSGIRRDDE